jgi:hypothetical protein
MEGDFTQSPADARIHLSPVEFLRTGRAVLLVLNPVISKFLLPRSWDGVFYGGWRSDAVNYARRGLHIQVGTAEYSILVSIEATGKLKASARHDERPLRAVILDCTETRAFVGR